MQMNDLILVSVDDHLVEPAHLFRDHVAPEFKDRAPHVITTSRGEERWVVDDKVLAPVGSFAVAGRVKTELHLEPANYAQVRRGTYDPRARIDDMNADGVLASLNFATMAGFSGEAFLKGRDKALMLAIVRAYNDWHLDEWCAAAPGRLIPVCFIPLWDADLAVAEIRRVKRKGACAICIPELPVQFGLPSFHRDFWDPIFAACIDTDIVVCVHIGTGGGFRFPSEDSPLDVAITTMNITMADVAADLLFSPVLRKFPKLKFALSEGYMGWVPFFKERADFVYEFHRHWSNQDFGSDKPSDLIRRHFLVCFTEDKVGIKLRHDIGIEMIAWECDYPHADSTWPRSPERLWDTIKVLPRDEIDLITHRNAMRFFDFDPFRHVSRADSTVGALRAAAAAAHVDVEAKAALGGYRPGVADERKPLTARDVRSMAQLMDEGASL